jgi:hypothetical protein
MWQPMALMTLTRLNWMAGAVHEAPLAEQVAL